MASKPHIRQDDYLAIKNALVILRDGSLTASMASNAPPALDALERLVEQVERLEKYDRLSLIGGEATREFYEAQIERLEEQVEALGNQLAQERSRPGGSFDQWANYQRLSEQLEALQHVVDAARAAWKNDEDFYKLVAALREYDSNPASSPGYRMPYGTGGNLSESSPATKPNDGKTESFYQGSDPASERSSPDLPGIWGSNQESKP